jgi:hypothetical protein
MQGPGRATGYLSVKDSHLCQVLDHMRHKGVWNANIFQQISLLFEPYRYFHGSLHLFNFILLIADRSIDIITFIEEELPSSYFKMAYIWEIANTTLSDSEKNRFVCCAMSTNQSTFMNSVDWDKATADFGAASVESMRKGITNALKKVEKAGGKEGVPAVDGAIKTPSTSGKGTKRKAGADTNGGGNGAEDMGTPTPKAKRGRRKQESTASRKGESRCRAIEMFVDRSWD